MEHLVLPLLVGLAWLPYTQSHDAADTAPPSESETTLKSALEERLRGDRTGACVAAALIDRVVSRAFVCADPTKARPIDSQTTFEIGSVSKTMTAFLLTDLIEKKTLSLDDTLAQHLPKGTKTPVFEGAPIRLKHLVTHTSGLPALPARMAITNPNNPYATLTESALFESLGDVTLKAAPGSRWAYSNFAVMLLSYVVSHAAKQDMETLIAERLFHPLGMEQAFIAKKPSGVRTAVGHLPTGAATGAWNFPANIAGVGGVRASLDDMIHYAQAELGRQPDRQRDRIDGKAADPRSVNHITGLMAKTQQPVDLGEAKPAGGPKMGMGWILSPIGDRTVAVHEGGTGGFSSYVAIDRDYDAGSGRGRAVVILADTALTDIGGLGDVGHHLLDPAYPMGKPRKRIQPATDLLQSLVGQYRLEGGLGMKLTARDGTLFSQADGQAEFELAFDSRGDFYPLLFDALLTPMQTAGGGQAFMWVQGGSRQSAKRVQTAGTSRKPAAITDTQPGNVADYAGAYQLLPGFVLTVTGESGRLYVQGTGQPRIHVDAAKKDVFVAESVGAELTFERDEKGKVVAVILRQRGQVLRGKRNE